MDTLTQILKEEVSAYAGNGRGANILLFPILDDVHHTYAVDYPTREDVALVIVLARGIVSSLKKIPPIKN